MKEFITPQYTFYPGASTVGYVDLSGISNFDIARLVAIINQTTGVLIYSTASPTLKFSSVQGNKVYLNFDTSTQSSTDQLQIIYNNESSTVDLTVMLNHLLNIIANPGIRDRTINADRMTMVSGVLSSGTLTTLTTAGNLQNFNGYQAHMNVVHGNIGAWTVTCRNKIS